MLAATSEGPGDQPNHSEGLIKVTNRHSTATDRVTPTGGPLTAAAVVVDDPDHLPPLALRAEFPAELARLAWPAPVSNPVAIEDSVLLGTEAAA